MIYPDSYTFEESFVLGYSAELYIELLECKLFLFLVVFGQPFLICPLHFAVS